MDSTFTDDSCGAFTAAKYKGICSSYTDDSHITNFTTDYKVIKGPISDSSFVDGSTFRVIKTVEGIMISKVPDNSLIVVFTQSNGVDYVPWVRMGGAMNLEAFVESNSNKYPETYSYTTGIRASGDLIARTAFDFSTPASTILADISLDVRTRSTLVKTEYLRVSKVNPLKIFTKL
jgi:hypothetical protein